jgi:hypothetical protein
MWSMPNSPTTDSVPFNPFDVSSAPAAAASSASASSAEFELSKYAGAIALVADLVFVTGNLSYNPSIDWLILFLSAQHFCTFRSGRIFRSEIPLEEMMAFQTVFPSANSFLRSWRDDHCFTSLQCVAFHYHLFSLKFQEPIYKCLFEYSKPEKQAAMECFDMVRGYMGDDPENLKTQAQLLGMMHT